jgi:hypothetical protein
MISYVRMLRAAKCGELSFMCCMTKQQVLQLRGILENMDDDDVDLLYQVICGCDVGSGTGTGGGGGGGVPTPTPTPGDVCTQKLLDVACSATGQMMIEGAKTAGVAALAAAPTPEIKAAIGLVLAALEALDLACENKQMTKEMLNKVCDAYGKWQTFKDGLTEPFATIVSAITIVFMPTALLGAAIKACCDTGGATSSTTGRADSTTNTSTTGQSAMTVNPASFRFLR